MVQTNEELLKYLIQNYEVSNKGYLTRRCNYKQWKAGTAVGTVGARGYVTLSVLGKRYYVHRLIFLMRHGYLPDVVDHINGDKTDNRLENLRSSSKTHNALNLHRPHKDNKCGLLGVYQRKDNGKWCAKLRGKSLGCFDNPEEASDVYYRTKLREA